MKILVASDLHYRLKLFDWLASQADHCDAMIIAGDMLDISSFRNIVRLYPDEPLFAGSFAESGGMVSCPEALEKETTGFCNCELLKHVPETVLFPCGPGA